MEMKYKILRESTAEDLAEAVNRHIVDGWEPLGGVTLSQDRDRWVNERKGYSETQVDATWAQAIIKVGV